MNAVAGEGPEPGWAHRIGVLELAPAQALAGRDTAIDRSLIVERVYRYGWAFDERQATLLADCFTEDGIWEGTISGTERLGPFPGRETIVDWMSEFWTIQQEQVRHLIVDPIIERQTESEAVALAYQVVTGASGGRVGIMTTGFYRFDLVVVDDVWKIAHLYSGYDAPFDKPEDE